MAEVLLQKEGTGLTKREVEVMKWIARGCSNKQIAARLFISEETVKKHVKNIFAKLSVTNRIAALRKAGML
jgi:two-component system, NarL family, nitrate/nitrite response regulator NarP